MFSDAETAETFDFLFLRLKQCISLLWCPSKQKSQPLGLGCQWQLGKLRFQTGHPCFTGVCNNKGSSYMAVSLLWHQGVNLMNIQTNERTSTRSDVHLLYTSGEYS